MKETSGLFWLMAIGIAIGMLTSLYFTFVILKIADYYAIGFLESMGFVQVYGLLLIKNLVFYKYKKDEDEEESQVIIIRLIVYGITTPSLMWFISWVAAFFIA